MPWRSDNIEIKRALDEIKAALEMAFPFDGNVDPAPWHKAFFEFANSLGLKNNGKGKGEGEAYTDWNSKISVRARYSLHRALLSGQLKAHFFRDNTSKPIPGWAWKMPERFAHSLASNALILSPLLPDEWHTWTCAPVLLDGDTFAQWLDTLAAFPIDGAPKLPEPHDKASEPGTISQREPPPVPDVSLSEAATWVAYYVTMNRYDLSYAEDGGELAQIIKPRFPNLNAGLQALLDAGRGSSPKIEISGRYEPQLAERTDAPLQPITRFQLADYRQPFWSRDALQWAPSAFDASRSNRPDGYRDVRVDRFQLLAAFPERALTVAVETNPAEEQQPRKRRGRTKGAGSMEVADAPLIEEMRRLIAEGKAFSPNGAAKLVVGNAKGGGSPESKADRLAKRYRASENN